MNTLTGLKAVIFSAVIAIAVSACQPAGDTPVQIDPVVVSDAVWPHDVSDLPPDAAVRYGRLENGLRYAILNNETPPNVASVRMVFNMGSLGEADDQRGLAHFIEHMAFNGSTNVPEGEMVPLLERHGLQFGPDTNAFTGYETVGYQLDLPEADEESIDTALFLMRETASELTMDADAIDRERGVILSEERFRNTALRRWNNALTRFRMPATIVPDRDAIGTVEVIETAPRERLVDYYENFYTPERGMVIVVGTIDVDAIEAKIEETFGDWAGPAEARPDPDLGEISNDRPFSVGYFHDPEVFTILTIDAVRPHVGVADTAENRFRNNLANLGDAIVSRRLETIVSSGTSPLLQAGASHTSDYSLIDRASVLAVATPDRWEEGLSIIEQELRRAIEHGFTQAELNEQMANLRTGLRNSVEQAGTRESGNLADGLWSSWRSDNVFTHPESGLERFEASADRVTVEAVAAAFRAKWGDVEPIVFLATSIELSDAENVVRDVWDNSRAVPVEAPIDNGVVEFAYTDFGEAGTVTDRVEIEDLGLVRFKLDNGVAVSFKQTDFEDGEVHVRVDFGRGELEPRSVPAVDVVTAWVFASSGLGAHSSDELNGVLAGRAVGSNFSVTTDSFRFGSSTTPRDLLTQLQLFAAYMTDPGWRDEGLSQFHAIAPEIRRNFYASPTGVLQAEVARLVHGDDPRYGFPDPEEVAGINIAAMQEFLTPALENAPIEITIVGDIDEAELVAALNQTFGALPDRSAEWPGYDEARTIRFPAANSEPLVLRHNGPDYQAMANIYWPTVDDSDRRRARAISLLRTVFDIKLTERLREAEGFTYSAFNSDQSSDVYPDYGYLWVGVDVRLENVDATYAAVEELAAELAAGDISDDILLRARRPLLEQIEEGFESNGLWMSMLSQSYHDDARLERIRTLVSDYESISVDELSALAAEYLTPETAWRVTILPRDSE
jgi:zinc protease